MRMKGGASFYFTTPSLKIPEALPKRKTVAGSPPEFCILEFEDDLIIVRGTWKILSFL